MNTKNATRKMRSLTAIAMALAMIVSIFGGISLLPMTAYAENTETLLTTITPTGQSTYSETTAEVATVTQDCQNYSTSSGWTWFLGGSVTVAANEGYTITKCVFIENAKNPITISTAPYAIHFEIGGVATEDTYRDMYGVTSIEVYGYATSTTNTPTYTVTYNANGAEEGSVPAEVASYDANASVTVLGNTGDLEKDDYTFAGWNTKADGTGTDYAAGDTFTITADTTLYAKWTENAQDNTPTVTITPEGAGTVELAKDGYDLKITATANSGYEFDYVSYSEYILDEWADSTRTNNPATIGYYYQNGTENFKDITIHFKSTASTTYNITKSAMANGSVTVKKGDTEVTKAKEGDIVTLEVAPSDGYQLKELKATYLAPLTETITATNSTGTYAEITATADTAGGGWRLGDDKTLTVSSTNKNISSIKFIGRANQGLTSDLLSVDNGSLTLDGNCITISNVSARSVTITGKGTVNAQKFAVLSVEIFYQGEFIEKELNLEDVTTNAKTFTMPASNVTVNATFKAATPATYTVTYNTNGGNSIDTVTGVTALPSTLPTPTKNGNTFDGWYTDSELTTQAEAGASITADTTLYAKWTENAPANTPTYTVTIPATLEVANKGWNELTGGITAKGSDFADNQKLSITASSTNSWALKKDETNKVGYNLVASGNSESTYSSTAEPASWEFSKTELTANGGDGTTKTAGIVVEDYSSKAAGTYEDTVTFTASVVDNTPAVVATDLSTLNADYVAQDGEVLTGTLTGNYKISVADGASVTLKDVNITSSDYAGITCNGDATITLVGTNTVKGGSANSTNLRPGIYVARGKNLTINGTGSLNASSSGISAGIGGGPNLSCGNITINGGTITATGGMYAAGIGGGTCGNITINGGTVTATGGTNAAGIGSSRYGSCGNITISNAVTKVTATKGSDSLNSIGKGTTNSSSCGTVTIGGTVYYDGSDYQNGGDTILAQNTYTYEP